MTLDREAIQRRDFPIVASGYEPAAVDAHLRALAAELERLGDAADPAHSAGSHVQSVLEAAQRAAAEIEAEARVRAEQTGAHAIAEVRVRVAEVARAAQALVEQASHLNSELSEMAAATPPAATAVAADTAPPAAPAPAAPAPAGSQPAEATPAPAASPDATGAHANGDLDGARLVALNMALSGEPRSATERYLAEHFQLRDRDALIDEIYAAVEE
ncbi:MAG TPA: hypothetical protein VGX51_00285 [Solirubrobacteraceae bacterium]|nr:hypothetical protein [Solirubrobacteraceae bacterium]